MKITGANYKHRRRPHQHTYDELTSTFERRQGLIRWNIRDGLPRDFMVTQVGTFAPAYIHRS